MHVSFFQSAGTVGAGCTPSDEIPTASKPCCSGKVRGDGTCAFLGSAAQSDPTYQQDPASNTGTIVAVIVGVVVLGGIVVATQWRKR